MLHVISAGYVARDLHTIAPGPLERTCWRRFAEQWSICKNSRFAPLNAIVTTIIITKRRKLSRGIVSWRLATQLPQANPKARQEPSHVERIPCPETMQNMAGKLMKKIVTRKLAWTWRRRIYFRQTKKGTMQENPLWKTPQDLQDFRRKNKFWQLQSTLKMGTTECNSKGWWNSLCDVASAWCSWDRVQQHCRKERSPCNLETESPRPKNPQWNLHKGLSCLQFSAMSTDRD